MSSDFDLAVDLDHRELYYMSSAGYFDAETLEQVDHPHPTRTIIPFVLLTRYTNISEPIFVQTTGGLYTMFSNGNETKLYPVEAEIMSPSDTISWVSRISIPDIASIKSWAQKNIKKKELTPFDNRILNFLYDMEGENKNLFYLFTRVYIDWPMYIGGYRDVIPFERAAEMLTTGQIARFEIDPRYEYITSNPSNKFMVFHGTDNSVYVTEGQYDPTTNTINPPV